MEETISGVKWYPHSGISKSENRCVDFSKSPKVVTYFPSMRNESSRLSMVLLA
jgi:hypothetical protein